MGDVSYVETTNSNFVFSSLPPHWRSNKSLKSTFEVVSRISIPDGTEVKLIAHNDELDSAELKNFVSYMEKNTAVFKDLRFVGRSGRGKSFTIQATILSDPPHVAELIEAIKITVDGPRVPRRRRGSTRGSGSGPPVGPWDSDTDEVKSEDGSNASLGSPLHADSTYSATPNAGSIDEQNPPTSASSGRRLSRARRAPAGPYARQSDSSEKLDKLSRSSSVDSESYSLKLTDSVNEMRNLRTSSMGSESSMPDNTSPLSSPSGSMTQHPYVDSSYNGYEQNGLDALLQPLPLSMLLNFAPSPKVDVSCIAPALIPNEGIEGQSCIAVLKLGSGLEYSSTVGLYFGGIVPAFEKVDSSPDGTVYCMFRVPAQTESQNSRLEITAFVRKNDSVMYACNQQVFSYKGDENEITEQKLFTILLRLHLRNQQYQLQQVEQHAVPGPTILEQIRQVEERIFIKCTKALQRLGQMRMLPALDADMTQASTGLTALHVAAEFGWASFVNVLLRSGAYVNQLDALGNTALDWAYLSDQDNCCQILLASGGSYSSTLLSGISGTLDNINLDDSKLLDPNFPVTGLPPLGFDDQLARPPELESMDPDHPF